MVKIMENPIKMDDGGVPLFLETSITNTPSKKVKLYRSSESALLLYLVSIAMARSSFLVA